jgi:hypothetical protein
MRQKAGKRRTQSFVEKLLGYAILLGLFWWCAHHWPSGSKEEPEQPKYRYFVRASQTCTEFSGHKAAIDLSLANLKLRRGERQVESCDIATARHFCITGSVVMATVFFYESDSLGVLERQCTNLGGSWH